MVKETSNLNELDGNKLDGFIPVSKWNDYHKYPTVKSLRQLIFYRKKYNFTKVLRNIGGRLYISEKDFYNWVQETGRVKE